MMVKVYCLSVMILWQQLTCISSLRWRSNEFRELISSLDQNHEDMNRRSSDWSLQKVNQRLGECERRHSRHELTRIQWLHWWPQMQVKTRPEPQNHKFLKSPIVVMTLSWAELTFFWSPNRTREWTSLDITDSKLDQKSRSMAELVLWANVWPEMTITTKLNRWYGKVSPVTLTQASDQSSAGFGHMMGGRRLPRLSWGWLGWW